MLRVCRAARAAASAAAAIASSDEVAVTWVDVHGPDHVVAGGGEGFLVGGDRGGVLPAQGAGGGFLAAERGGLAGADELGGGEPGPGLLDDQAGQPERRTGPEVRFPAPVIVVLSSPNVVSDALHRVRYASRTWSAGAASVIEEGGDHGAGLGDLFGPVAGRHDRVVLGDPDREPVRFLPGRGVQPAQPGPVGQPAAVRAVLRSPG